MTALVAANLDENLKKKILLILVLYALLNSIIGLQDAASLDENLENIP